MSNASLSLPCALEIEEEILGLLLRDSGEDSLEILEQTNPEDFFNRSNRLIFQEILELFGEGKTFDLLSVTSSLKDKSKLVEVGGSYHLSKLTVRYALGFQALRGLEVLKEKTRLRKILEVAEDLRTLAYNSHPSQEIIENVERRIGTIESAFNNEDLTVNGVNRVLEMVRLRKSGEKVYGIETGIKSFDDVFFGLQQSQYYVIAGRPSAGKTAFVDQVACRLINDKVPSLYISLESSEDRVVGKIACKMARISYERFIKNKCNESELTSISQQAEKIRDSSLMIKRPAAFTSDAIRSMIMREIRKKDIKVFFIDYIQKIVGDDRDPRICVMNASMKIQDVCVQTKACGVVIAQMNRDAEKESRPRMGHLKESGQIEQDADNICLLWSEKDKHELQHGEMMPSIITIEKNKDGISGIDQKLFFDRELMTFKERNRI